MTTATQKKQAVAAEVMKQVAADVAEQIAAQEQKLPDGKLDKTNSKGEMLMCNLTLQRRVGAPDPLCVTINEEIRWLKRGMPMEVPWYVIEHLKNNVETVFRQETDEHGKRIMVSEQSLAEPFSYAAIDPAPGVTI